MNQECDGAYTQDLTDEFSDSQFSTGAEFRNFIRSSAVSYYCYVTGVNPEQERVEGTDHFEKWLHKMVEFRP